MDTRSRIVAMLKVLLPLTALGLLSTMFLLSRSIDPTASIPYAEREIAERVRDQQITAPFYAGTTERGDEITVTASRARPGIGGMQAEASDIEARITMSDGVQVTLTADTGRIAQDQTSVTFLGDVEITSTTGYVIRTEQLNTMLDTIAGDTPGTVTGTGPIGDITAGQMQFREESGGGPLHMLFKNGVKLVYTPKKPER